PVDVIEGQEDHQAVRLPKAPARHHLDVVADEILVAQQYPFGEAGRAARVWEGDDVVPADVDGGGGGGRLRRDQRGEGTQPAPRASLRGGRERARNDWRGPRAPGRSSSRRRRRRRRSRATGLPRA